MSSYENYVHQYLAETYARFSTAAKRGGCSARLWSFVVSKTQPPDWVGYRQNYINKMKMSLQEERRQNEKSKKNSQEV